MVDGREGGRAAATPSFGGTGEPRRGSAASPPQRMTNSFAPATCLFHSIQEPDGRQRSCRAGTKSTLSTNDEFCKLDGGERDRLPTSNAPRPRTRTRVRREQTPCLPGQDQAETRNDVPLLTSPREGRL